MNISEKNEEFEQALKDLGAKLMQKTFFWAQAIKMGNLNDIVTHYLEELKSQPELYRPGIFWEKALHDIAASYCRSGHDNFRNDGLNLSFFCSNLWSARQWF